MPKFGEPGGPPINRRGRPPKPIPVYREVEDDGAPAYLLDMRHIYTNDKKFDRTEAHRFLRKYQEQNGAGFMKQLEAFEEKFREEQKVRGKEDGQEDAGAEKCIALCEELLDRLSKGGS